LRRVAALPGSDHDRQRQAVPINTQVDFASDAAA
jgi:hypothetical protein